MSLQHPIPPPLIGHVARRFMMFGQPVRLRIIEQLELNGEMSVQALAVCSTQGRSLTATKTDVRCGTASPKNAGSRRLRSLAGTYRGAFETLVTVTVEGQTVSIEGCRDNTFDQIVVHESATESDTFLVPEGRYAGERLTFVRRGDAAISHFELGNWVYARVDAPPPDAGQTPG